MKQDWKIEDVPLSDHGVFTEIDPVKKEIKQITSIAGRLEEKIIKTQSNQMRNALIDLGWTPPPGEEVQQPVLDSDVLAQGEAMSHKCSLKGIKLCDLTRADLMVLATEYCMELEYAKEENAGRNDSEENPVESKPGNEPPVPK